jgi:hypothetical protein
MCTPACYFSLLFLGPFRELLNSRDIGEGIVQIACFSDAVVAKYIKLKFATAYIDVLMKLFAASLPRG